MIKKKASLTLLAIGLLLFTGCNTSKDTSATTTSSEPTFSPTSVVSKDADVLEIGEKMFLTQIDDIYFYFDDYKDKTIIVEGMYSLFYSAEGVKDTPVVFRYGPGCCGNDGWGGFLLNYDGAYPEENEWIRVVGTPELVTTPEGYMNLYLNVLSLDVQTKRGAEYVTQ